MDSCSHLGSICKIAVASSYLLQCSGRPDLAAKYAEHLNSNVEYVLFPLCKSNHWPLLVLCVKQRCVLTLDSGLNKGFGHGDDALAEACALIKTTASPLIPAITGDDALEHEE